MTAIIEPTEAPTAAHASKVVGVARVATNADASGNETQPKEKMEMVLMGMSSSFFRDYCFLTGCDDSLRWQVNTSIQPAQQDK